MRFPERDLKPYSEPVLSSALEVGEIYFSVNFADEEMLVPTLLPIVFLGRDLEAGDKGRVYFQDLDSYRDGVRYQGASQGVVASFTTGAENAMRHIFSFPQALDVLLACSLRRDAAKRV